MKYNLIPRSLLFGLISGILFSVIDSVIFLLSEKEIRDYIKKYLPTLDIDEISIILGALSSAISIFFADYIDNNISSKLKVIKRQPLLDATGIIFGVFIVIGLYELLYKKYIKNSKNK